MTVVVADMHDFPSLAFSTSLRSVIAEGNTRDVQVHLFLSEIKAFLGIDRLVH